ncbi:dTDP-4-dehydrorhamnose 3,5-epimerase [Helicobacter saguini]|uniref:dTDP-4-dehydrorhamnose 3,5-epimerase n=1 Tax=Helicobacter saguini TaxID=1548018 RepID=A0A347VPQ5_9HELI|nr:dTDP-4-dehydrorhamnose 3,5-epimerase family protein [Helicobacter saguini]MWV61259.1 dTDP-4-dehydrorhamnose 3,5-epimerase [Helicobacter saguini]MWV68074.1 dTDP-4-dehydrorhamnose 3,5-epimerase [Helicobacter saguini]MWV70462.1 dTDP-4-dehydrorhamnose 3,5-epimerase [Helicobacter saguini]MWV72363.1 dTDP-4-dehydrorhamnose 3,5-epimerase [Helicobacter saguini]TLD93010.1 dTDP-4-keto-6-deoxy-D-glucose epimerase [Helicobacter saguini]
MIESKNIESKIQNATITQTPLNDLVIITPNAFSDNRGEFIKQFNFENFAAAGLKFDVKESFYSVSKKGVLRGMHFQTPPHEHKKLVYVASGKILDVVLDMRLNSSSFKQYFAVILDSNNHRVLYIPSGFAHGFLSLENDTKVCYMQTSGYNATSDSGISFDSFDFDWEAHAKEHKISEFIISNRDKNFESFESFAKKRIF